MLFRSDRIGRKRLIEMSKIVHSPISRWPGDVTLHDTVTYPLLIKWNDSIAEAQDWTREGIDPSTRLITDQLRYRQAKLPGLVAFVESHTLRGLPVSLSVDNFPALPIGDSINLLVWLNDEIDSIIQAANEVPND